MIGLVIAGLIVFVLSLCFGVLFGRRTPWRAVCTKSELLELFSALPDNARIYISIDSGLD